ncbi:MAG: phosphodiester glycosidase family protein [Elusimicrobia bacterium]|nr:phosphodiester glycosidase family protein [Elusimicrobiota bacterium]
MIQVLAAIFLAGGGAARAERTPPKCWAYDPNGRYIARIEDPTRNFSVLFGRRRLSETSGRGAVVVNGTFFWKKEPLGDVIEGGAPRYLLDGGRRRAVVWDESAGAERRVDFGLRWGIGVDKESRRLFVLAGDQAVSEGMRTYLGGGGLLLKDGQDATALNRAVPGRWGPSFSAMLLDEPERRTALGIQNGPGRLQTLLVVGSESRVTIAHLARVMQALGAEDAVFYDGGDAAGFAAGGEVLIQPDPDEDLNPTHIILKACR